MAAVKKNDRSDNEMHFADLIRDARIKKRLSQRQLGEQILTPGRPKGIWNTYIGQIEKGDKIPSDEICKKFAEVLELDLTQVLLAAYEARVELTGSDEAIGLFQKMRLVLNDPVVQRLLDAEDTIDPQILEALTSTDIRKILAEENWRELLVRCYRLRSKRNVLALLALVESMTDKQWKGLISMLDAMGLEIAE
jgi:transcriptional regulator with XRE-family HTH domain